MTAVRYVAVVEDDADIRLDRWFARHFPRLPHGRLQRLLRTGQIRVDGGRARNSTRLRPGQEIRVPPFDDAAAPRRRPVTPEDADWVRSMIIHSDDEIIALNKPPGLAVQGGRKIPRHLDAMLGALARSQDDLPRLVHRLDRDTSGVILIARRSAVAAALAAAFRSRDVSKSYWALVTGVPEPPFGTVETPLLKRRIAQGAERVVPDPESGKPAVTDFRVLAKSGDVIAWLLLEPRTGRTHQLRVHCAELGTPIFGDRKYGGQTPSAMPPPTCLHLHARSLEFPHPAGGRLRVSAPLPEQMMETWRSLGLDTETPCATD